MVRKQILGVLIMLTSMNGLLATNEPAHKTEQEKKESSYWDIVTDYVLSPVAIIGGIFFLNWAWKKGQKNLQRFNQNRYRNSRSFDASYSNLDGVYDFGLHQMPHLEENQMSREAQQQIIDKAMEDHVQWHRQVKGNPGICAQKQVVYVPSRAGEGQNNTLIGVMTITDGPEGRPHIFVAFPQQHSHADQAHLRDHLLNHLNLEGVQPNPATIDALLRAMAR